MLKLENSFGIKKVFWKSKNIDQYCPLGKDWCTFQYEITFVPSSFILDYALLNDWITENIQGQENTHESATRRIYEYIKSEIDPLFLEVKSIDLRDGSYCII